MPLLTFPVPPLTNGQLYPQFPLPGQNQYQWDSTDQTWRLIGAGTAVVPGTYGNATNVAQITIDAVGRITFAQDIPLANTVSSITAGTGLNGGTITTSGTISLDTAYTDTLYLRLVGDAMSGDIAFAPTQTFPGVLPLTGGTMTGDIIFNGTQTFPNTVTSVTAGIGLLGGIITSSGTIDLDTAYTDGLYLGLAGGTMTGDIVFSGTQTFPAQDINTVTTAGNTTANSIAVGGLTAAGLIYPLTDGAAGDYLTTDGAGTLGWVTPPVEDLQSITDNGATTTNSIDVAGLTAASLIYPLADGAANEVMATDGSGNLGWIAAAKVVAVPGSQGAAGNPGEIAADANYFYWFDGAVWQRVAAGPGGW